MTKDTQELRELLETSNKNTNQMEEEKMASIEEKRARKEELRRQAEEAKMQAAQSAGASTEEVDESAVMIQKYLGINKSDLTDEGIKQADGSVVPYPTNPANGAPFDKESYGQKLLADAIIASSADDASDSDGSMSEGKTNLFNDGASNGSSNDGDTEELSPEEQAKRAERAKRKLERELEIKEANRLIQESSSKLINQTSDKELTPKQKEFQQAASSKVVCEGLIVESNPYPELTISRKGLTDKDNAILQDGVTREVFLRHVDQKFANEKRYNLQDYSMGVNYKYRRAGALLGGILTLPASLNITPEKFEDPSLVIKSNQELKDEPKVTILANFDTLFTYIVLYCGGKVSESEIMKNGNFLGAATSEHKLTAFIDQKIVTRNDRKVTEERRIIKALNRKQLCVQENIIPVKVFETINLSKVSSDPATSEGIMRNLRKSLDKKKGEIITPVTKVNKEHANLFKFTLDEAGNIDQFSCNLVTGSAIPGQGPYTKLGLNHWSNFTKDSQGKDIASRVSSNPVVRYTSTVKESDRTQTKYSKTMKILGQTINFEQVADMGYPAARVAQELGVKEGSVKDIYTAYIEVQKRAREARNVANGNPVAPTRVQTKLDQDISAKLLIQQLNQKSDLDLGMNGADVASAMISNVYNL